VTAGIPEAVRPGSLPQPLAAVCAGLAALGALVFVAGLFVDEDTTWRAFHVNYLYFAGLAQGGVVIASIFVIVGATWPGPIRRLAEALGAWIPISVVLYLIGFLGRHSLYSWIEHPIEAKSGWLNTPRLFFTDLGVLLALALLSLAFLYYSLRPTLHGAASRVDGRTKGLFEWCTRGWRGEREERERCDRILRRLAPIICLAYAFGFTVIAFDQVMSLSPSWFSNLFGAYFSWGAFLSAVAATALLAVLHRRVPGLEGQITQPRLHDIGKMVFAFSIFWMYLFFSQYLVIWYGNLEEERFFLHARLGSQFFQDTAGFVMSRLTEPYAWLTMIVWLCCWIVPFWVLLGQRPKRTGWILGSVGLVVAFGFWLERNVLVWPSWPSLSPNDPASWLGWIQLGVAAGFVGAFALVYLLFTRVFPSLAVSAES
jgi:hypothetical protein